jgi:hypothetical protein
MRTVLAAAAAGALIMGSAAGAMAAAPSAKTDKNLYVHSVSIKGHSPLNVFDAETSVTPTTTLRDIAVRVSVRDKKSTYDAPSAVVTVELDAYRKKVSSKSAVGLLATPISVTLEDLPADSAKWDRFGGAVAVTADQAAELKALIMPDSPKVYLCISDVTVSGVNNTSTKVKKRINPAKGKVVRDCVKVINVSPDVQS